MELIIILGIFVVIILFVAMIVDEVIASASPGSDTLSEYIKFYYSTISTE